MNAISELPSFGLRPANLPAVMRVRSQIESERRVVSPVEIRFTPGLASRQILMKAGTHHMSKRHGTHHQFVLLQGSCFVKENGGELFIMNAPFHGETLPGTWREIIAITDCLWTTFHSTLSTSIEEIESDIIIPFEGGES